MELNKLKRKLILLYADDFSNIIINFAMSVSLLCCFENLFKKVSDYSDNIQSEQLIAD